MRLLIDERETAVVNVGDFTGAGNTDSVSSVARDPC